MDSDSDSDGSHVSATPPSSPAPPPAKVLPPPVRPPPPPPILLSNANSKVRVAPPRRSAPSNRKRKSPPQTPKQNLSDPPIRELPVDPSPDVAAVPSCSFPIRRHTGFSGPDVIDPGSVLTLAAGSRFLSKSTSFSKMAKRVSIDSDSVGNDSANEVSGRKCAANEVNLEEPDSSELKNNGSVGVSLEKRVKKPSNLIGSCGSSLFSQVKRPKSGTEGNFVKLNLNGRGRWSKNKGKNRNFRSYKSKWRGAKRSKPDGDGASNEHELESIGLQEAREGKMPKLDDALIVEAVKEVTSMASDSNLLKLLKLTHGYDSFREGQLEAIKMVLELKSTMLVLPTGAGKSLCYQLPALVFTGVTLVVSPLVSLMIDQLKQLPPMIPGAVLCSSQSSEEVSETLELLQNRTIKVLFVSPERFLNEEFMSIVSSTSLVSLVVVDEAHCISEWSHNFRPSYMRLRQSILGNKLKVGCILAMTATATTKSLNDIMSALEIPPNNLIKTNQVRTNLQLSVSLSGNSKMKELTQLIKSTPFSGVQSIIIYCKFQHETDTISKWLCDNNIRAKSYHSGIPAKDRSRIQASFCSNKIRVVVATVAFGMGLDKSDVGAVIHYSLPGSIEEYVQGIGRAGRDGRLSYCHLFYDEITYFKLRSFAFSDGVDEYAVNKFLAHVFTGGREAIGKVHSMIIESTARKFDIKEEVMLTILTQLELGEGQYLSLLPQINVTCSLNFHKTPALDLARKDFLIAAIIKRSETKHGTFVFDIPTVGNTCGLSPRDILNELSNLKYSGEITYELKDPAYCYSILNIPGDICSLAAQVTKWLSEVERCKVKKLDDMSDAVIHAVKRCERADGCDGNQHTACLQRKFSEYFLEENEHATGNKASQSSPFLRSDIKVFLQSHSHAKFTPRAIARIMHGIGSPAYPSANWSKAHFWGRYSHIDFKAVVEAAKAELMTTAGK